MKIRKRLSVIAVACCIVAGLGILPAASADTTGPAVASALWEVSSDTITLTDNVAVPDYMLYGEVLHDGSYVDITADSADDLLEDWQTSGLLVTAQAANKPLTFKNTVDIRAFTADDVLFAFTPLVASRGSETFKQLDLRLTDAEDPDNWVNIKFEQSRWVTGITVISVETPEFGPIGYKWGDYHADYRDDISSIGFSDNYYISFKGRTSEGGNTTMDDSERYRHRPIILHYDAADKCFYVTGQGGKRFAVLDLDDSHAVGYGYEWDGFGSGRVNVTVTTGQHMGSEIEYLILNAFDTPMGGTALTDTAAPVLAFGAEVQGDYAPVARTGYPYTLPDYTCDDIVSGALTCDIAVTDPDGQTVSLSDGGFTPGKDGLYKAVYTASDAAGNTVLRTLNIVAQKGVPAIEIDVTQPDVTEYAVGQDIVLPEASVRAGTGSGLPSLSVQVVREGAPNEPIAVTDGIFTPAVAGRYDAVYTAVDYLGTTMTKTIVYTVTDSDTPVEKGQVQRLRRLYDGIPVEIPVPEVYDYSSYPGTGVRSAVKVIVSGNGQSEEVTGPFTPDIDRFGTELTVRYEVGEETPVVLDEYTVAVTAMPEQSDEYEDVGAFQVTEYFTWDDSMQAVLNTAEESGYLQFKTEAGYSGDAHFSFNNPVRAENFSLSFAIPAAYQNFDSLVITLSDSVRADITFDLELCKITTGVVDPDTKTFVDYNGIRYAMNGRFNKWVTQNGMLTESNSVTPMRITYHDGIVGDADGDVLTVTHNTNGTAFYGFPSGKVYVDFTFRDVDGSTAGDAASGTSTGAGITIAGLVNQSFYADYWTSGENAGALRDFYDLSAPQIVLSSDLPDRYTLNQRVQIPYAAAYDVLSPYVEVTVSLQGPDGSMIFDNQPVSEGMAFTVSEYGSYFLEYRATDASGLGATRSYTIAARDYTPPTIALSATSLTGRVGQAVTLPDAVVQDERDTAPKLFVIVFDPSGVSSVLGEGVVSEYTPTVSGTHRILFCVIDSNNNMTMASVTLEVE